MPKVIIYTTPSCVYCKMAKEFFKEHAVAYEEINVAIDEKAQGEMIEKSGQMGVPVIDIGGEIVIGYDKEMLIELLGIKK
ncbi:thioredoxin family protein [Candidatus Azambacteria bacterium]|nr:thioredoxin family protein [Candidatus Azambacteria bacterium]MBI3685102.1 thioredoxin family protein [Candidatus Azambacteria bacterium]